MGAVMRAMSGCVRCVESVPEGEREGSEPSCRVAWPGASSCRYEAATREAGSIEGRSCRAEPGRMCKWSMTSDHV